MRCGPRPAYLALIATLNSFLVSLRTAAFLFGTTLMSAVPIWAEPCIVTNVHDGDTFTARCADGLIRVRVASIDAPELKQAYGMESRGLASRLLGTGRQKAPRKRCSDT
jgi:endonuclease YncB( thermonuclease family)